MSKSGAAKLGQKIALETLSSAVSLLRQGYGAPSRPPLQQDLALVDGNR